MIRNVSELKPGHVIEHRQIDFCKVISVSDTHIETSIGTYPIDDRNLRGIVLGAVDLKRFKFRPHPKGYSYRDIIINRNGQVFAERDKMYHIIYLHQLQNFVKERFWEDLKIEVPEPIRFK